jgi:hypothetical protein
MAHFRFFLFFSPQYDKNDASVLSMHLGLWLPDCFLAQLGTCTSGIVWPRALRFAQALVHSPSVAAVSQETVPVWAILTPFGTYAFGALVARPFHGSARDMHQWNRVAKGSQISPKHLSIALA